MQGSIPFLAVRGWSLAAANAVTVAQLGSSDCNCHALRRLVQILAELASALSPYMTRYCQTMAAEATPSIFLEAAEADMALCGGPDSTPPAEPDAASECSDMSDDEWWREELLASSESASFVFKGMYC